MRIEHNDSKEISNNCNCKTAIIKVKKLQEDARIPIKMNVGDSGFDVCSTINTILQPSEYLAIPTGLSFEIPENFEIQVRPRSGLAINHGVTVLNTPGTIDSTFKGEVKIILINHSKIPFEISKGFRIAQLVPMKISKVEMIETLELSTSQRGENGFGSTGIL